MKEHYSDSENIIIRKLRDWANNNIGYHKKGNNGEFIRDYNQDTKMRFYFGVDRVTKNKIVAGLLFFPILTFGFKGCKYTVDKVIEIRQIKAEAEIEKYRSLYYSEVQSNQRINSTLETLANQYYFPVYYNELPDATFSGILASVDKEDKEKLKYKDKDGQVREFELSIYKVYEKGGGLINIASEMPLDKYFGKGNELKDFHAKILPRGVFDSDSFVHEVLNGQPITQGKLPFIKYFITARDLAEIVQPDTSMGIKQ